MNNPILKLNGLLKMLTIKVLVINFIFVTESYSCSIPPYIQRIPYENLISKTKDIVLVKIVNAKDMGNRRVNYTIETIEQIKGISEKRFEIEGSSMMYPNEATDFNSHSDKEFWEGAGRTYNNSMCNISPSFAVGQQYLIFINSWENNHVKSYELILSKHDLWYKKVKELVK